MGSLLRSTNEGRVNHLATQQPERSTEHQIREAPDALDCRAVVLNPAVDPARDLVRYVGEQTAYHDPAVRFEFKAAYIDELRALTPPRITRPERYAAVIAKGDELFDWREMSARYAGARVLLLEGSDHVLSDFEQQLPFVLEFLQLPPASG